MVPFAFARPIPPAKKIWSLAPIPARYDQRKLHLDINTEQFRVIYYYFGRKGRNGRTCEISSGDRYILLRGHLHDTSPYYSKHVDIANELGYPCASSKGRNAPGSASAQGVLGLEEMVHSVLLSKDASDQDQNQEWDRERPLSGGQTCVVIIF